MQIHLLGLGLQGRSLHLAFPAHLPAALRYDDAMGIAEALRKDGYTDLADDFEFFAREGDLSLGSQEPGYTACHPLNFPPWARPTTRVAA